MYWDLQEGLHQEGSTVSVRWLGDHASERRASVNVRCFEDPKDFYQRVVRFLLEHEACNSRLHELCTTLIDHPERYDTRPYLATCEDSGRVAAAAVRTPPLNVFLSHAKDLDSIAYLAVDLHRAYSSLPGVLGPEEVSREFAERWREISGQSYGRGMRQRFYKVERIVTVPGVPGELRAAASADRDLLVNWLTAFSEEVGGSADNVERVFDIYLAGDKAGFYFWHDRQPVSMAGYGGPTPHGIRVSAVYTPPEHRGKGYASALVATLSQLLLDSGRRYCFLFTDRANLSSNELYRRIGYEPVCDVDEYRFQPVSSSALR